MKCHYTKEHKLLGLKRCDMPNLKNEIYSARYLIAWDTYPKLYKYRNGDLSLYPSMFDDSHQWEDVLDKMLFGFEWILIHESHLTMETEHMEYSLAQEGLELFGLFLNSLY